MRGCIFSVVLQGV